MSIYHSLNGLTICHNIGNMVHLPRTKYVRLGTLHNSKVPTIVYLILYYYVRKVKLVIIYFVFSVFSKYIIL